LGSPHAVRDASPWAAVGMLVLVAGLLGGVTYLVVRDDPTSRLVERLDRMRPRPQPEGVSPTSARRTWMVIGTPCEGAEPATLEPEQPERLEASPRSIDILVDPTEVAGDLEVRVLGQPWAVRIASAEGPERERALNDLRERLNALFAQGAGQEPRPCVRFGARGLTETGGDVLLVVMDALMGSPLGR
jgi:hypothetical protein